MSCFIHCRHCGAPVTDRGRPGGPANRCSRSARCGWHCPWGCTCPIPAPRWTGLEQLLLIANTWRLARLLSYLSLERPQPPVPPEP